MRALFIAAHADDVEISAGGTIQVLIEEGYEVWTTTTAQHAKERTIEAVEAAEILGAIYIPVVGSIRYLTTYWDDYNFSLIVTPSSTDSHEEHRQAAELGVGLARGNDITLMEMNHAIPGGIYRMPQLNHFVTFSVDQMEIKALAVHAYRSQKEKYGSWWPLAIKARDRYYGLMADRVGVSFAEGFNIVHS